MGTSDAEGRVGWQYTRWAQVAAVFAGVLGIVVAVVLIAGAQLVNSPMATAGTTRATPWVPIPAFNGKPVPHPKSSVSSQGNSTAQATGRWAQNANKPFKDLNQDMKDLYQAFQNQDIPAAQTACHNLSGAGQNLAGTLPAPSDSVTAEAQSVVNEVNALTSACLQNPPDGQAMQDHASAMQTHMSDLYKLVNGS